MLIAGFLTRGGRGTFALGDALQLFRRHPRRVDLAPLIRQVELILLDRSEAILNMPFLLLDLRAANSQRLLLGLERPQPLLDRGPLLGDSLAFGGERSLDFRRAALPCFVALAHLRGAPLKRRAVFGAASAVLLGLLLQVGPRRAQLAADALQLAIADVELGLASIQRLFLVGQRRQASRQVGRLRVERASAIIERAFLSGELPVGGLAHRDLRGALRLCQLHFATAQQKLALVDLQHARADLGEQRADAVFTVAIADRPARVAPRAGVGQRGAGAGAREGGRSHRGRGLRVLAVPGFERVAVEFGVIGVHGWLLMQVACRLTPRGPSRQRTRFLDS